VNHRADLIIERKGEDILLISAAGDQIQHINSATDDQLLERIQRQVWVQNLVDLTYPEQSFNVSLNLLGPREGGYLMAGESFGVTIRLEKPAYLLLLNISPAGKINVIYPYFKKEIKKFPADIPLRLANLGAIKKPFGIEYLKVFAFQQKPEQLHEFLNKSNVLPGSDLIQTLETMIAPNSNHNSRGASMEADNPSFSLRNLSITPREDKIAQATLQVVTLKQ
jgi:hypothetical protein